MKLFYLEIDELRAKYLDIHFFDPPIRVARVRYHLGHYILLGLGRSLGTRAHATGSYREQR